MRNRSQDLNYESFTRNRLMMFEYSKKPVLDQLERIEDDMERLIPQNDSEKLRRPGWARMVERDISQLLSKLSQFDQRRYADLQERIKETEEKFDAEDDKTKVRRVAQRPAGSVEHPAKPRTEEPLTIMRRRGGGRIKRDEG